MVAGSAELRRTEPAVEELLGSVHAVMQSLLRHSHPALEAEGISMGQFWALHLVSSLGSVGVSTVARHLAVSAPTVCAKVDELESAGLLVRHRSERDRRVVELRLTPKGKRVEARIWEQMGALVSRATRGLSREEIATATRVFRDLRVRLDGPALLAPGAA